MTASELFYSPNGRRGIGVNQPQSGLDYPFVSPSDDIKNLIADCRLEYSEQDVLQGVSQTREIAHPLRIKWLYGLGSENTAPPADALTPSHAADVLIVDANNVVVFDTTAANVSFSTWCWGLRKNSDCPDSHDYQIYEWRGPNAICHIVAYKTWPISGDTSDDDSPRLYPTHLMPQNAVLDERASYKIPQRVTSFILVLDDTGAAAPTSSVLNKRVATGSVDFAAGFNAALTPTTGVTSGFRGVGRVGVNVIAGAGAGRYADCVDDTATPITNLNGLEGPDILISASDCLWARTPGAVEGGEFVVSDPSAQQLGSDCQACCTCQDYVDIAKYMNTTRDRYRGIGVMSSGVLAAHTDNIAKWLDQQTCRTVNPIKVCMTAQRCPFMDIVVQYCNLCTDQKCAENVNLAINFAADNVAEQVCGHTKISSSKIGTVPFRLNGSWPNFSANIGNVDVGNSASVTFRLKFESATPTNVQLTATGTTSDGPILTGCDNTDPTLIIASATTAKSLYCNEDGDTAVWCA